LATVAVAIGVGANPRSEEPSDAAYLTALALAGALWVAGIVVIVARWRAGRSLYGVSLVWAGAASVVGLVALFSYPEPSRSPTAPVAVAKASPALRALGKLAFAVPARNGKTSDIFVMHADGTGLVNLTRTEGADERTPAWSPDGREIAFSGDGGHAHARDVYAIAVRSRALRNVTRGGANYQPAWSPDGEKIAFASERWDEDAGQYDDHYEIYVRHQDAHIAKLTRNDTDDLQPAWSPDGATIAFNTTRDGNWEIYAMSADGAVQRNLSDDPADDEFPAWSPDGKHILFVSDRDGQEEVYVMNANGTAIRMLTHGSSGKSNPVWSPDGRKIAFINGDDRSIYLMNADGSRMRRILAGVDRAGGLTWQPRTGRRRPAPKPSAGTAAKLCKRPGLRYVGRTGGGGKVCFTLTVHSRALREVAFSVAAEKNCPSGKGGRSSLDFGSSPIALDDHGRIALAGGSIRFQAEIRSPAASGVFVDKPICGARRLAWTARRVSGP
jgi:TolB protein